MYQSKLCLGTSDQFEISVEKQIRLFKEVGFDGFFTGWNHSIDIKGLKKQQ